LIKCYGIESQLVDKEFIEEYNDKTKMGWYRNLTTIINYDDVLNTDLKLQILKDNAKYDSVISNCYLDFTKKNKYAYHYYAIEIINKIGFNINDLKIEQPMSSLMFLIDDCIEWMQQNKNEIVYKYDLLKYINKDLKTIDKFIDKLRIINSIIESQYGLKIKKKNTCNDIEKIKYCLTDNDIWKETIKIKPIQLYCKRENYDKYKNHDNSDLDVGLFLNE
jgi:hypothetical protein